MCGRYTLAAPAEDLAARFLLDLAELHRLYQPRYNIAPSQPVLGVTGQAASRRVLWLRWGLTPTWSRDGRPGPINARSETVFARPMFRQAIRQRRCLVPADGFFEWTGKPPHRSPWHFSMKDGHLFAMAGIWEEWLSPSGERTVSACLITTSPNSLIAPMHDRMPVIVRPEQESVWLDPAVTSQADLDSLMTPYDAEQMQAHQVSRAVSDPRVDSPECIRPLATEASD